LRAIDWKEFDRTLIRIVLLERQSVSDRQQ
jgi:hypothetical protein